MMEHLRFVLTRVARPNGKSSLTRAAKVKSFITSRVTVTGLVTKGTNFKVGTNEGVKIPDGKLQHPQEFHRSV